MDSPRENTAVPSKTINVKPEILVQALREEVEQFEIEKTGNTLPDDIPAAPKEAITKIGDLWILGDHRLLCGSSTNETDVARLMDGNQAQLLATDPPYLVDYTGKDRPGGGKDWSDTYHEVDIKDAHGFFNSFLAVGLKHVVQDAAIYVWHADRRFELINSIFRELDILLHQHIIWVKPCTVMTYSVYPWRHEPCLFGWRRGSKPFFRPSRKSVGSVWVVDLIRSGDPESPEYYSDLWEVDWEGKKRNNGGVCPNKLTKEGKRPDWDYIDENRLVKVTGKITIEQPGDSKFDGFDGSTPRKN